MNGYTCHRGTIPEHMLDRLRAYIETGCPVGDFLTAVLCNDLREACSRADDHNVRNLAAYVVYLYNEAPSPCWGSPEKHAAWIERHRAQREKVARFPA